MKKNSTTQILRHIIQCVAFVVIPGLFVLVLSAIESILKAIIAGNFSFSGMLTELFVLLAVIPITALWSRFFCGWLCAFGTMQEFAAFVARKLKIKQITISERNRRYLKWIKYVILVSLVILWIFNISLGNISPWNVFGQYSSYKAWGDLSSFVSVGGLLLGIIIILSFFHERFFCRYLCPLGGIFAGISKARLFKIKKNAKCVHCGRCSTVCPMGIDVDKESEQFGAVKSGECIDCFRCTDSCALKALRTTPKEAVSGTVASLAMAGLYFAGSIPTGSLGNTSPGTACTQGQYTDGTYQGSAAGYRGTTTVSVKVENGNITSITVESYADDSQFFNKAKSSVIDAIISKQSTEVQTVSGATYSSLGIIGAVADALGIGEQEAVTKQEKPTREQTTETTTQATTEATTEKAEKSESSGNFASLADGTYQGTGQGRNGSIAVSVTIKSGKITGITIESSGEDAPYLSKAKETVIAGILDKQSINVSTASGATMSPNGILEAVADALNLEFENPNSSMPADGPHGGKH
ncbi:MAG: FMN-binding protein [Clostridia bacterium]|nr:FMN-binding protein [Clostridia bacterium]